MSKSARINGEFEKQIKKMLNDRYNNGNAKLNLRELGLPEGTRLIINTPSWNKVMEEARKMKRKQ